MRNRDYNILDGCTLITCLASLLILTIVFGSSFRKGEKDAEEEIWRRVAATAVLYEEALPRVDTLVFITDHLTPWQELLLAIAYTESRFNPCAVGKDHDTGVLQLTPIYIREANRIAGAAVREGVLIHPGNRPGGCLPVGGIDISCLPPEQEKEGLLKVLKDAQDGKLSATVTVQAKDEIQEAVALSERVGAPSDFQPRGRGKSFLGDFLDMQRAEETSPRRCFVIIEETDPETIEKIVSIVSRAGHIK